MMRVNDLKVHQTEHFKALVVDPFPEDVDSYPRWEKFSRLAFFAVAVFRQIHFIENTENYFFSEWLRMWEKNMKTTPDRDIQILYFSFTFPTDSDNSQQTKCGVV